MLNDKQRLRDGLCLGGSPIQTVNEQRHLGTADRHDAIRRARPDELSLGQALLHQQKAGGVVHQNLDRVCRPAPKHEKMAAERILTQHRLDLRGQAVDAATQVGPTRRQVNTHAIRQADHERLSTTSSSRSKVTASKPRPIRTTYPPGKINSTPSPRGSGTLTAGSATWTARNVAAASGPADDVRASTVWALSREFQYPTVPAFNSCFSLYSRSDRPLLFQPAT